MKKTIILGILLVAGLLAYTVTKHPRMVVENTPTPIVQPTPVPVPQPAPQPINEDLTGKQVIVFAFDGSRSLQMWQNSLDFAKAMNASGKPIHFTYFISGVYFLTYTNKLLYLPPKNPAGTSLIGYADSKNDVIQRVNYINRALAEGHEIGSHANGHFDGTSWSLADWEQEFSQFEQLMTNFIANNQLDPYAVKLNITTKDIIGFRAPNLGRNVYLWPTLVNHGFVYDTSSIGKLGDGPIKADGLWKFAVPSIKYANTNSYLLAMDYNFYIKQTGGKDLLHQGTVEWQKAEDEMYTSYINYFNNNYNSSKAPVLISHHFSEWNDRVYWEAMKKFAETECGKADVRCVTYKELVNYLNTK